MLAQRGGQADAVHAREARRALPPAVVGQERKRVAGHEVAVEAERAGAERASERPLVVVRARGDDVARVDDRGLLEETPRRRQLHDDLERRRDVDALEAVRAPEPSVAGIAAPTHEVIPHRLGVEDLAVVALDARAEHQPVGEAVVGHVPPLEQHADERAGVVEADERLVERGLALEAAPVHQRREVAVGPRAPRGDREPQRAARCRRGRGRRGDDGQERQKRCNGDEACNARCACPAPASAVPDGSAPAGDDSSPTHHTAPRGGDPRRERPWTASSPTRDASHVLRGRAPRAAPGALAPALRRASRGGFFMLRTRPNIPGVLTLAVATLVASLLRHGGGRLGGRRPAPPPPVAAPPRSLPEWRPTRPTSRAARPWPRRRRPTRSWCAAPSVPLRRADQRGPHGRLAARARRRPHGAVRRRRLARRAVAPPRARVHADQRGRDREPPAGRLVAPLHGRRVPPAVPQHARHARQRVHRVRGRAGGRLQHVDAALRVDGDLDLPVHRRADLGRRGLSRRPRDPLRPDDAGRRDQLRDAADPDRAHRARARRRGLQRLPLVDDGGRRLHREPEVRRDGHVRQQVRRHLPRQRLVRRERGGAEDAVEHRLQLVAGRQRRALARRPRPALAPHARAARRRPGPEHEPGGGGLEGLGLLGHGDLPPQLRRVRRQLVRGDGVPQARPPRARQPAPGEPAVQRGPERRQRQLRDRPRAPRRVQRVPRGRAPAALGPAVPPRGDPAHHVRRAARRRPAHRDAGRGDGQPRVLGEPRRHRPLRVPDRAGGPPLRGPLRLARRGQGHRRREGLRLQRRLPRRLADVRAGPGPLGGLRERAQLVPRAADVQRTTS